MRDIGFLESVKRGQITLGVAHIVGPSIASLNEIADIAPFVTDGKYYLVKNFINETSFFDWDQTTYDSYFKKIKDAVDITIPKLNEMAYEQVELASVPFVTFIANKGPRGDAANYSFVLRGYVRHWLGNVWAEFDRVKLPDLVTPSIAPAGNGRARPRRTGGGDPRTVAQRAELTIRHVQSSRESGDPDRERWIPPSRGRADCERRTRHVPAKIHHHRLLAAPARRQDADRARAHRVHPRGRTRGDRLRRQSEQRRPVRLSAALYRASPTSTRRAVRWPCSTS